MALIHAVEAVYGELVKSGIDGRVSMWDTMTGLCLGMATGRLPMDLDKAMEEYSEVTGLELAEDIVIYCLDCGSEMPPSEIIMKAAAAGRAALGVGK